MIPFNTHNIRVVTLEGEPWFVAKDVCEVLGLDLINSNAGHHIRNLDPSEVVRGIIIPGIRGTGLVGISESGLYKLALKASGKGKPNVKAFQDHVTKEILPSIRKTGAYGPANRAFNSTASASTLAEKYRK